MKACVTVTEQHLKRTLSIIEKFDFAEIRLDLCEYNTQQIKAVFSSQKGLIATYRIQDPKEMGSKMEAMKLAMESGASFIDLEYDLEDKYLSELVLFAKNYDSKVIISYHNFKETPSDAVLHHIIKTSKLKGANWVKIATKTNSREDSLRLMNLYNFDNDLIAFGIGEDSKFTRINCLYLGAPFTYVYFGTARHQLAEGQLSHREFSSVMEGLGG